MIGEQDWFGSMDEGGVYGRRLDPGRGFAVTAGLMRVARIPARYQDADLGQTCKASRKALLAWARSIPESVPGGASLLLTGKFGTGKTSAAVALLIEGMCCGSYALFFNSLDLERIYTGREVSYEDQRLVEKTQMLVLDDVGAGRDQDFGLHGTLVEKVVRHRYNAKLSTLVTTNLTPTQIKKRFPGAATILLGDDSYGQVELGGVDRRVRERPDA